MKSWNGLLVTSLISWKNDFILLRHGKSLANEQHLIVSKPPIAIQEFGLSEIGRTQAAAAVIPNNKIVLIASDFRRAHETAVIVRRNLSAEDIPLHLDVRLRERDFGGWDLTKDSNYQRVWDEDVKRIVRSKDDTVEPVESVLKRGIECLEHWNEFYTDRTIVFVSHGDVLQILQTHFAGIEPYDHRLLPHLDTAVPRVLIRRDGSQ